MIRAALLAVIALVVACSDDHGILVMVHSPDGNVTKIRLFVGTGAATTKNLTIAGPITIDGATYYDRDPNDRKDVIALDRPSTVRFAYETSDDIPLAIAIGYDNDSHPIAAGMVRDLVAPTTSNQFNAYQIDLLGNTKVFGTSGALQLGLWSNVSDTAMDPYVADCAGIQLADEATAYFVVSPDDEDCDGYTNADPLECTPDYYNGSVKADRRKPSCLIASPQSIVNSYCSVGGQPCADGRGPEGGTCKATNVCAPSSAYGTCHTDFGCAANMQDKITAALHYECTLPSDGTKLCATTARLERPPTGGIGCSDFQIGNATFGAQLTSNDMELTAIAGKDVHGTDATSCDAMIQTNNGKTAGETSFTGITNFTLNNNGGIAIPILFTIANNGCAMPDPITCTIENDGTSNAPDQDVGLTACAAGWTPPVPIAFGPLVGSFTGGATVTSDGMEMFYAASDGLHEAKRSGTTWINGTGSRSFMGFTNLHAPKLSPDGMRLLFMADVSGSGRGLYEIKRSQLDDPFSNSSPTKFVDQNMTRRIQSASYTSLSTQLVVSAVVAPDTTSHLYTATIQANTTTITSQPFVALSINSTETDGEPSVSFDGLHLYFVSNRDNKTAVYVSSRATVVDSFARAVLIDELAVTSNSYPFVTVSGYEMFLTSPAAGMLSVATRDTLPNN